MSAFKKMIGKSYLYMGKEVEVKEVAPIGNDMLRVVTSDRAINVTHTELRKEFLPIDKELEKKAGVMLYRGVQLESKEMANLGEVLMSTIKKVQEEANYVKQARTINETAKTLIDLKRAQLELIKLMKS